MIFTFIVNIVVYKGEYKVGVKTNSTILKVDAMHTKNDLFVTLGVMASMTLVYFGFPLWIDPLISLVVAFYIFKAVWEMFKEVSPVLLDEKIAKYLSENMSFVVIDECHTAPTEIYTSVITKLKPRYKLGLTATPRRQDGNQYMLENYIGSRHFIATQEDLYAVGSTIKPNVVTYLVLGKTSIMEDHWNERLIKKVKKPIFWRGAINQWIARKSIHKKIASLICAAYKKNRSIAVILKEKKIITMYYDLLIEMGVDKDEIVIMIGDTEKDYRKEIIDDMKTFKKKIILTSKL
jgi:superfamily II DNA or RNA helicase